MYYILYHICMKYLYDSGVEFTIRYIIVQFLDSLLYYSSHYILLIYL